VNAPQTIDIDRVVDAQKIGRFITINLVVWLFLAAATDGYDLFVLGYAAPELVHVWHLNRAALGPVFAASSVGMLFGAPFFGYLGDKIGRKTAMIVSMLCYGLLTLATVLVGNLEQLTILRFVTGLFLAGIYPNALALQAEYAPSKVRATMVILVCVGLNLGSSWPGLVSAYMLPHFGWGVLFFVGGLAPMLIATCMIWTIPESVKYLVTQPQRRAELAKLLQRLSPGLTVAPNVTYVGTPNDTAPASSPRKLFEGKLGPITGLFWFMVVANVMTIFFLNNWMPTLFVAEGVAPKSAALATALFNLGGVVGALILALLLDRIGLIALSLLFVIACPAIALIGAFGIPVQLLILTIFVSGLCAHALQAGIPSISAVIYPTNIRSKGVGWVAAIGRLGAIAGPLIGGVLVGWHWPLRAFFVAPVVPMALGAVAAYVLMRLAAERFRGRRDESSDGSVPLGVVAQPHA